MTIIPIFPNIIHQIDVENFKEIQDSLVDYVYEQENLDPIGVFKSNEGGWQSKPVYSTTDNIIKSTLEKEFEKYFSNVDIFKQKFRWVHNDAWININRNNSSNRLHCHAGCDISGVFWIKVPQDCDGGHLQFSNPHEFVEFTLLEIYSEKLADELKSYNVCAWKPIEGRIVIFPSHLMHEVRANKSRQDRISVSFNISIQ